MSAPADGRRRWSARERDRRRPRLRRSLRRLDRLSARGAPGSITVAIATSTRTIAAPSCQCSCSFSHHAPESDAEHRDHHHRHARGDRRQVARHDQPDRLGEAEDQDRVVGDRAARWRRGGAVQRSRSSSSVATRHHAQRAGQRHPEDDRQRRRRRSSCAASAACRAPRPRPRTSMPSGGAAAGRLRAPSSCQSSRATPSAGGSDAGEMARPQPLAEQGDAPERREDRHGVAEDRGPARRERLRSPGSRRCARRSCW